MRRLTISTVMLAGVVGLGIAAQAGEDHHDTPVAGSAELEQVKQLAGRWEGSATHMAGGADEPAAVEYKITSGGSAVVETLFPGTPHEMVSIYHDGPNGKLSMTHYCMLHNQPQLDLVASNPHELQFSLSPSSGIPASEHHMHQLTMTWTDPDHMTQEWISQQTGQSESPTTIRLSRVR